MEAKQARYLSIILGAWLFISAFVWPHTAGERTNTWICGALAVIIGIVALRETQVRYLNTILAIWVFISAFMFGARAGTSWNNAIVGVLLFASSLVGERRRLRGRPAVGEPHRVPV